MSQTDPKILLINILKNNILVYESDDITPISGVVAGSWYNKKIIGTNKWQISVGPTLHATVMPNDIGANSWDALNDVILNIWIPILENPEYTPETLRFDLKEEVKRLMKAQLVDPASDVRFSFITGWRDADEREDDMLRVEATIRVEWNET